MPAFLVPVEAGHCLIPLEKAIVMIGRQADCDVSLTNSRKISRRHCCIAQVNNRFVVRDLGSTNGVYLNGNRVQKEAAIAMGDDLVIGDIRFKLLNEAPVASNPAGVSDNINSVGKSLVPPVPGAGRNTVVPPIPKIPTVELDDAEDDDVTEEENGAGTGGKAPNTLEGIRRFRSSR